MGNSTQDTSRKSLIPSSINGAATQLVTTSAIKSVIRLGRYLYSRTVQGSIKSGTWGVKEKMEGSQKAKTPKRRMVVVMISRRKEDIYPNVKEV